MSAPLASATTILIVGDSISAAYGIQIDQGWVTLLQQKLNEETDQAQVVNASVSGETTSGAKARFNRELKKHQPDIVIIELGGNDGLRGLPPRLIKKNLANMIEQSQTSGAKVLLLGMRIPPNYGKRYTEMFAQVFYQLERQYAVPLVPFLLDQIATDPNLMQPDGIHPTAEAQPILVEMVLAKLRPLILTITDNAANQR